MSLLTKCPVCEGEVSKNAESCPHCGEPFNVQKTVNTESAQGGLSLWGVVLAIIIAVVIMSYC